MASFATYSKLKQLALMVVAYKSTTDEIGYLRDIFQQFDTLGNGEITVSFALIKDPGKNVKRKFLILSCAHIVAARIQNTIPRAL